MLSFPSRRVKIMDMSPSTKTILKQALTLADDEGKLIAHLLGSLQPAGPTITMLLSEATRSHDEPDPYASCSKYSHSTEGFC